MNKIKTIKRTAKMPKDARYVLTRVRDGKELGFYSYLASHPLGMEFRRIVDAPKKPKKAAGKMVRVWYFWSSAVNITAFENKASALERHRKSLEWDPDTGPIQSALIPAPRKKGGGK